jgi:mannose-6-phosphate isomerase
MSHEHAQPYPLTFRPLLMDKVWGGDRLARFNKGVAPGARVGESWEVADMASTSASGAGGGAARSVIASGALAGRTLGDAIALWGHQLLGAAHPASAGGVGEFPLLIKYLDAREDLSVQVHPSPAYAAHHPGANLKTECWYILDSEPGSKIYKGVRAGVTRETFERALREGDGSGVVELMEAVPAVAGECHNLPSGTVHALGAGVLVAEVQTPSDTTFRVYDWGRRGRELHVAQALACIDFGPAPHATRFETVRAQAWQRLVSTKFFTLDEARPAPGTSLGLSCDDGAPGCVVLMVVSGRARLECVGVSTHGTPSSGAGFEPVELASGSTLVLPAACADGACLAAGDSASARTDGPCVVLCAGVVASS